MLYSESGKFSKGKKKREESLSNLSKSWKDEIDRRYQLYKEGKAKLFTWEEVKQRLRKLK